MNRTILYLVLAAVIGLAGLQAPGVAASEDVSTAQASEDVRVHASGYCSPWSGDFDPGKCYWEIFWEVIYPLTWCC